MGLMARVDKVATQRQQGVASGMLQTEALPSSPGRSSSWGRSGGSRRVMASNRIGIVEFLLGMVVVYFAYSLLTYANRNPHVHGDDPVEVRSSQQ